MITEKEELPHEKGIKIFFFFILEDKNIRSISLKPIRS